jgi:hypothetical protein
MRQHSIDRKETVSDMTRIGSFVALASLLATATVASAAEIAYAGPAGWSHVDVVAPSDSKHSFAQWHIAGDISTVTYIADGTTAYVEALANIRKNFRDNGIKASIDKDVACHGGAAHVIEFAAGPEGKKIIINRMLVPSGDGIVTITYARADSSTFDRDVEKSEATFCGATS